MKLVFFIGYRQLLNYHLEELVDRNQYRLMALIPKIRLAEISKQAKGFDQIYGLDFSFSDTDQSFAVINFQNAVDVIEKEQRDHPNSELYILCQEEISILRAVELRQYFNCSSTTEAEENYKVFRDKVLMKRVLANKNIRVPHFDSFNAHKSSFELLEKKLKLPFILKPKSSMGSQGVYKIHNQEDFDIFYQNKEWENESYEAEEFIEGKLYHCDSFIKEGKIQFLECCEYTWPNFDYRNNKSLGSIPLLSGDSTREDLLTFSRKVLYAFGMPNGAQHMELFVKTNGEIIFLEIGARVPGVTAVKMYVASLGINLLHLELVSELGATFNTVNDKKIWCFWTIFPPQAGKIKALIPPPIKSHYEINWHAQVGEQTQACRSLADVLASIMVYNEDYEQLYRDFLIVKNHVAAIYE